MNKWGTYFIVGFGCFFGGMLRFFLESIWDGISVIPLGTLSANVLGTLIIGLVTGIFLKYKNLTPWVKTMITTGFCGGLTTFSSFSLDVVKMFGQAPGYDIAIYISLTMLSGLFGVFIGLYLILGQRLTSYFIPSK